MTDSKIVNLSRNEIRGTYGVLLENWRREHIKKRNINPTELIYSGEMTLRNNCDAIKIKGTITNLFSYTYRIKVEGGIIETKNNDFFNNSLGEYNIEAGSFNGKVYIYKVRGEELVGQVINELSTKIVRMDELNLELVNLRAIGSELVQDGNFLYKGLSFLNRIGWEIELKQYRDYKIVYEELKEYGGFACTHNVRVYRKDNSDFNYDEAISILEQLYSYLAFICGRRIYPSSYKGSKNGKIVFIRYESRLIDQWNTPNTWYPKIHKKIYNDLFNSVCSIWEDPSWAQSKNVLLGTYLECFSTVTLENRISSIQIALEMITRIYLVKYKGELSNRKFKSLDTKDLIRVTCSNMGILLDEPEQYLRRNIGKASDPIIFFVDVRNSIVHSKMKVDLSHDNLKCAYYIGLWFLELWLLKVFKYKGKYKNRLSDSKWEGDVENGGCYYPVPWADDSTSFSL